MQEDFLKGREIKRSRRMITEPKQKHYSVQHSRNSNYELLDFSSTRKNTLQQFQHELNTMALRDVKKQKNKYKIYKKMQRLSHQGQRAQLDNIKQNLSLIRQRLDNKRHNQINDTIKNILMKNNEQKQPNKIVLPTIFPPYMNPYPIPPPQIIHITSPHKKYNQSSSDSDAQERRRQKKNKKKLRNASKQVNKLKLNKLLKKVFRAVVYIFYLKKLVKLIVNKRKVIFNKFWPDNLLKATNGMRKWFSVSTKKFFDQMIQKSQLQLQIEGDESQKQLNRKKKAFKQLFKTFIQCLQKLIEEKTFQQIAQVMHIFCKHGAYIDNGVLTPEEIDTVCISDVHGYLRMDRDLQKSQIINFLFIKIVIFNMLLQPWKYNNQIFDINENKQGYQNFYTYSSIFYQMMLNIQDELLKSSHNSNQNIQIGNWKQLKTKFKIKCSPSLCHLDSNHQQDEMISGLLSEKAVELVFNSQAWNQQLKRLKNIINKMHNKLRLVHAKFINQIYNYKNLQSFKNRS